MQGPEKLEEKEDDDQGLALVLDRLPGDAGVQKYRATFLKRRIEHRMRTRGIQSYREYAELVSSDPGEHAALTSLFSITVTEFFRDPDFFEILRSKLLPLISESHGRIRIWCAGCATGEEPYSIAILALELAKGSSSRIQISATDMNPGSIKIAEDGTYEQRSLKNVPGDLLSKYFHAAQPEGNAATSFQVNDEIKQSVVFNTGDLVKAVQPASHFDMILCRNVMIYFDRESRDTMLKKFYDALKPDGYFVMGQSEVMTGKAFSLFRTIYSRERVYQKI